MFNTQAARNETQYQTMNAVLWTILYKKKGCSAAKRRITGNETIYGQPSKKKFTNLPHYLAYLHGQHSTIPNRTIASHNTLSIARRERNWIYRVLVQTETSTAHNLPISIAIWYVYFTLRTQYLTIGQSNIFENIYYSFGVSYVNIRKFWKYLKLSQKEMYSIKPQIDQILKNRFSRPRDLMFHW